MTGPGGRPTVVIVDDHGLFRSGVRSELGDEVDVIGEADDVQPAIELIARRPPDVVLLDVHLPGGGGQAVLEAVKPVHPGVRFLALSASDAPEDVIAVVRAGARGYVTKTISGAELVSAVRRVAAGDVVFSPRLAGFVLDAFAAGARPAGSRSTRSWTSSPRGSARCCASSPAAIRTGRSPRSCSSRSRRSRATSPRCCASSSSRPGTS